MTAFLILQCFWKFVRPVQVLFSYLWTLAHQPHIHIHPHMEYRIELKADALLEYCVTSKDGRKCFGEIQGNFTGDKEWTEVQQSLQNYVLTLDGNTALSGGEKLARDLYMKMIDAVKNAQDALDEFHSDITIWYFLERFVNFGRYSNQKHQSNGHVEDESLLPVAQSIQEIKHILMHAAFILMPCWLVYFFCIIMFSVRVKERGIVDYGFTALFTTNFLQDLGKYLTLIVVVTNFISAYRYKVRQRLTAYLVEKNERRIFLLRHSKELGKSISSNDAKSMSSNDVEKSMSSNDAKVFSENVTNVQDPSDKAFTSTSRLSNDIVKHSVKTGSALARMTHWTSEVVHYLMQDLWLIEIGGSVFYIVVVTIWVLLGMFLDPVNVAPFATAVLGLAVHILVTYNKMMGFFNEAKLELKAAMQNFKTTATNQVLEQNALEKQPEAETSGNNAVSRLQNLMRRLNIEHDSATDSDDGESEEEDDGVKELLSTQVEDSCHTGSVVRRQNTKSCCRKIRKSSPYSIAENKRYWHMLITTDADFFESDGEYTAEIAGEIKKYIFGNDESGSNTEIRAPKLIHNLILENKDMESITDLKYAINKLYSETFDILKGSRNVNVEDSNVGWFSTHESQEIHLHLVTCKVVITLFVRHDNDLWLFPNAEQIDLPERFHNWHTRIVHEVHHTLKGIKFRDMCLAKVASDGEGFKPDSVDEAMRTLAEKSYWEVLPYLRRDFDKLRQFLDEKNKVAAANTQAALLQKIHEADIQDREILDLLAKHGVSVKGIALIVLINVLLLLLIFAFLFIGMLAFSPKVPDSWQSALNSFMVALATLGTNLSSGSGLGGSVSLRMLIEQINIPQHYAQDRSAFVYELDEDASKVLQRAAGLAQGRKTGADI